MKIKMVIILLFLLVGCKSRYSRLTSNYFESTCYIQKYPGVTLKLKKDGSFIYNLAYLDEKVTGKWKLNRDTLILTSDFFDEKEQKEMMPKYKYTDYSVDKDAYLLKKDKLYIIDNSKNAVKECFLIKI